jgi:hypothetical protein
VSVTIQKIVGWTVTVERSTKVGVVAFPKGAKCEWTADAKPLCWEQKWDPGTTQSSGFQHCYFKPLLKN